MRSTNQREEDRSKFAACTKEAPLHKNQRTKNDPLDMVFQRDYDRERDRNIGMRKTICFQQFILNVINIFLTDIPHRRFNYSKTP
ncbi:hypothetical protein CAEBREN_03045 [Caenorhabditis brenneri]|uniref:Uncharacterized protein n=1 Tax=Caenorhabditis brenneri TaxID=135651 RepID=G0P3V5_CAEBE|nr:hypothetical protein CAEBREN_03045 [Caenorhabditis brenneri]